MMTAKEVAEILLARQNSAYSFILDGATRQRLTAEGFAYARQRGWLEIDEVTNGMRLSMRAQKLAEMKEAAAAPSGEPIEAASAPRASTDLERLAAIGHADVVAECGIFSRIEEGEPVVISGPAAGWTPYHAIKGGVHPMHDLLEAGQVPPAATSAPDSKEYNVGDSVIIGEGGNSYQATVQAKRPDGSLVLSFGDKKPGVVKPTYKPEEVGRPAAAPGAPAAPAAPSSPSVNTGGPSAPGIGK